MRLRALRVGGAPGYARLGREEDGTWGLRAMRSPAELRLALADVGFLMRRAPGKPLVRMPFADAWMRDPGARTLEAAVCAGPGAGAVPGRARVVVERVAGAGGGAPRGGGRVGADGGRGGD